MEACCISRQGASPPDIQLALEAKSSNNSQAFLFHARIDLVKDGDMIEQLNCGTQAVTPAAVFWAFVFCGQSAQTIWHASLMTWGVIQRVCGGSCGSRQGYINVFSGTGALTSADSDQLAQLQDLGALVPKSSSFEFDAAIQKFLSMAENGIKTHVLEAFLSLLFALDNLMTACPNSY